MIENEGLRNENSEYLQFRDRMKRDQQYIARENDRLVKKIEELQRWAEIYHSYQTVDVLSMLWRILYFILFSFILSGDSVIPALGINSTSSSRQNSLVDSHSGMNSASSSSTLRSYHSVPDVYHAASLSGTPVLYSHSNSPVLRKVVWRSTTIMVGRLLIPTRSTIVCWMFQPSGIGLPPVKHKSSPIGSKSGPYQPFLPNQPVRFIRPSPPLSNGVPLPHGYAYLVVLYFLNLIPWIWVSGGTVSPRL